MGGAGFIGSNLVDELINMSNKGAFKAEKITQAVLQRCNMVVTAQNTLRRKLGQWNVLAEDSNCNKRKSLYGG